MRETIMGAEGAAERKRHFTKCIVALTGPPLVGKTTLGQALAKRSDLVFLDVDDARWHIFPKTERLPEEKERQAMLTSYEYNHERARRQLDQEKPVILGATYSRKGYHQMLRDLAKNASVPLRVFLLEASDEEIIRRVQARQFEGSDSTIVTAEAALEVKARYSAIVRVNLVKINSDLPVEENTEKVLQSLSDFEVRE